MSDTAATTDQIEVIPVTGSIGAEIAGVQLRALDDATFAVIRQAFLDHSMLVFRDQHLTIEEHK
ncbi:MAG: TauD/TfdA family dioxygenase, partial [Alphaproteobacteria bacterium]